MTGGENGGTAAWPGDLRSHREAPGMEADG
jgi:hypothetical protein